MVGQLQRFPLLAILVSTGLLLGGAEAKAGKYNKQLDIGDQAPTIPMQPAVDGENYGMESFADADVLVVVFTCNDCPYALDYEDRFIALQKQCAENERLAMLVINPNAVKSDSLDAMRKRASDKGFKFPYIKDETGEIAESYGALRTPECFVLDSKRKVIYMGAFDDSSNPDGVKEKHVTNAISCAWLESPVLLVRADVVLPLGFLPR